MKCPKCGFTHGDWKFCPHCGVPLVDSEESSAGGEGPGPPDSTEHQNSPAVSPRQEDLKSSMTKTTETSQHSTTDNKNSVENNSNEDSTATDESITETKASSEGCLPQKSSDKTDYASPSVSVDTETKREPQTHPVVGEGDVGPPCSSDNKLQNDSVTDDLKSKSAPDDHSATKESLKTSEESSTPPVNQNLGEQKAKEKENVVPADSADDASTEGQRNDDGIDVMHDESSINTNNKPEETAQSARLPPTQPASSSATLNNQEEGVMKEEPPQMNRQTNDGSGNDDGKGSQTLDVTSTTTYSQSVDFSAVSATPALPQGNETVDSAVLTSGHPSPSVLLHDVLFDEQTDSLQNSPVCQVEASTTVQENRADTVLAPGHYPHVVPLPVTPRDEQTGALQNSPVGQVELLTTTSENGEDVVSAQGQSPPTMPLQASRNEQTGSLQSQSSQDGSPVEESTPMPEEMRKKDTYSDKAAKLHGHADHRKEIKEPHEVLKTSRCHSDQVQGNIKSSEGAKPKSQSFALPEKQNLGEQNAEKNNFVATELLADKGSTYEQGSNEDIEVKHGESSLNANNKPEDTTQSAQEPPAQLASSATLTNQEKGVMKEEPPQIHRQTNDGSGEGDGKDSLPLGVTSTTTSSQSENSSAVLDTPVLPKGKESPADAVLAPGHPPPVVQFPEAPHEQTGSMQNNQKCSEVKVSTPMTEEMRKKKTSSDKAAALQGNGEHRKEITEPDKDQQKSGCRPAESEGENGDNKKILGSEKLTSTQGSAPEGPQAGTELEKEQPDTMTEMPSERSADQGETRSQTEKDTKIDERPNEQRNESSEGRKGKADPSIKEEASDRTKADQGKSSRQDDGEQINADQDKTEEDDNMGADKLKLYFHVLLRPGDFKYDPEQDHVEVRSSLSKGFTTLLKMSTKGKTDDYLVFEGQKSVSPEKVAGKPVEYKYAVVREKENGRKNVSWEFIHRDSSYVITNRCMLIPKDRAKPGGIWHQYDDFMLPEDSAGASLVNWVKESFGFRNGLIEAKAEAVKMWLPKWEGLYCGADACPGNASDALSQIDDVERGIARTWVAFPNSRPEVWELKGFNMNKVVEDYMSRKWDTLFSTSKRKQCPKDRLVSALAITYLVWKFSIKPSKEREEVLLQALSVTVDTDKMTCEGLKEVFAHFDPVYIGELPTSIYSLVQRALLRTDPTPKWLLAIPILHFLRGDSRPFKQPDEEAKVGGRLWFGLEGFDKLKAKAEHYRPRIKDFIDGIGDLLRCDPLLPRIVAAVLKLDELEEVFRKRCFSPSVSIATIGFTITKSKRRGNLGDYDMQAARKAMEQITAHCREESSALLKFHSTEDNGKAIREMCSVCEYSLGVIVKESKDFSYYTLVISAVSMVASCMRLASTMLKSRDQEVEETDAAHVTRKEVMARIAKCYESTSEAVHTWLKKTPWGGIASTKSRGVYESALTYRDEPEMWSQLVDITFGEEDVDAKWRQSLKDRLNERIKQVSLVYQAELFCQLDLEKLNSVVAECFTSAAFAAVESLCETKQEGEFMNNIAACSTAAEKYGKLFSYVLRKTWRLIDEKCESSLLLHLLTWQPFLGFFKMYAGTSVLKETLDEDCQEKIAVAVSEFEDVQKKLLDRTLTVESLQILLKCSCRFLELSKIITPYNEGREESKIKNPKQDNKDIFSIALDRRRAELEAFEEERRQLQTFLGMTEIIVQVDSSTLQRKVDANVDHLPVDELCAAITFDDKKATANGIDVNELPCVTFFNLAPHVKATLGPVGQLKNSILFHAIWMEQAEEVRNRIRQQREKELDEIPDLSDTTEEIVLSMDEVVTEVCQPALRVWEKQRQDIETGEITLKDVDKYFGGIMGKERDLHQEIATLSNNPKACWVKERTDQIRQYHLLEQYTDKARSVIDVRQTFKLEGDFSSVQALLDSKSASSKMRPLKSIDDSVFEATSTLAEMTEATSDALNVFVLSKPLVEWIRMHTKDTKELKVFADLASISAGETDIEIDRVNMLLSAGIGYGPLIYDLKQDSGFAEMMQSVKKLETYLAQDPNLPKKLRDMKDHLAWLTHVQESHGSVEKSSLSQAEAINAKGIYDIGHITQPKEMHEPLDGVISLRLSQSEGDADDRQYSVSNLKTLQSKLMLIAGTAHKGKEEVEKFVEVFNGVIRLGNVYLRLRRTGSVLFDKWTCTVFCDPKQKAKAIVDFGFGSSTLTGKNKDLVTEVTNLAKSMESCLEDWLEFVDFKRGVYPELNNFTTEQIVVLRRQLANAVNGEKASSQAIVLLDSVKTLCTVNDLQEAFSVIDLNVDMADDTGDGSLVDEDQCGASNSDCLDLDELLRELHDWDSDLSDDAAKAALKVSQRGNHEDTLNDAMDWYIENYDNDELVRKILGETEDNATDQSEQDYAEANLEQSEEQGAPRSNTPSLAPLTGVFYLSDLTTRLVNEAKDRDETLVDKVTDIWHRYLKSTQFENMKEYLSLDHLGHILQALGTREPTSQGRPWPDTYLKEGVPNLIVCPADDMLRTVLSMYLHGGVDSPLPSYNEVLLCTPETTTEEIVLLLRRAMTDQAGRIFCLVNIDQLDHDVSVKAEEERSNLMQQQTGCHLVLTCASEKQHQSYLATALEQHRVQQYVSFSVKDIQAYLATQLVEGHSINGTKPASVLDYQRSSVRVISSDRPGMGKSLYVQRLAQKLRTEAPLEKRASCYRKVPFHEAVIDVDSVLSALNEQEQNPEKPTPSIIHLDVSPLVRKGLDHFLFNLTVLGRVMGKDGKVWLRLPWDLYLIERTSGTSDAQVTETSANCHSSFVTSLPFATCRSPNEILASDTRPEQGPVEDREAQDPIMYTTLFTTEEFQRPYQYLRQWEAGEDLDKFTFTPGVFVNDHVDFLTVVLRHCGIKDPSWAELRHFLSFLNYQLRDFEQSDFCKKDLQDSFPGLRKFVVEFMIIMSKDFATPSLEMADESPSFKVDATDASDTVETDDRIQYHLRRRWENCPHPYLFFNSDHHSMTFLGFHVDRHGNIRDLADNSVIKHNVIRKPLRQGLDINGVDLHDTFDMMGRVDKIRKLRIVMGLDKGDYFDPDESYELTTDNVKKILAIHMRFRCNIPVIIMGETGCGKTRLVKFMCDLQAGHPASKDRPKNMIIMKLHGGVSAEDIIRTVTEAQRLATENRRQHNVETVLFLDEANTSEAIGLIKEIMCDRTVNGKPLPTGEESLKIVAAVNPYRRHTRTMIRRLEQAGLGYHIRAEQTEDKLGRIPMRQLVYRVQPLPPSMLPLVWDFGQLNEQAERLYIQQMVKRCVSEDRIPAESTDVVTAVLTASQEFMRKKKDDCSFVSLRDVERTLTVMAWFLQVLPVLSALMNEKITDKNETNTNQVTNVCRALILALGVCYQARLEKRKDYRKAIAKHFNGKIFKLPNGTKTIERETERCQDVFLDQMDTLLAPNIARNTALKENVFMMVVCIELRIPLFLVGKPGSSKSLAKSVVSDAMQGDSAPSDFFKRMKQAHMVSFQCSPLATPESIVKTFHQCSMFQQDKDLTKFVSVVVLDEIGLAEDSPKMPLKTLHALLEEGYVQESGNNGNGNPLQKKVAFVGISNWALDPAKMNRGIFLSRGVPDKEDLKKSARGICKHDERVMTQLQTMLGSLAGAYTDLYHPQLKDREYFGLRDFYSLIKMVSNFCRTSGHPPSRAQLEHAIKRNFSGRDDIDPLQKFRKVLDNCADKTARPTDPDCSPLGLIKASLQREHGDSEGRYLLVLTKNYAALALLQQEMLDPNSTVILFGSSFPQDQEYTQICRDINRIKVCMETGRTVVLLNLENLYESLYDALNQYYVEMGGQKYVDLGLGTHRVKCRVHKNFRLLVVAEKDIVYEKFPIPLINRLEKHVLSVSTILTPAQCGIAKRVDEWAKAVVNAEGTRNATRNRKNPADAFIGYHEDLPATVVIRVCQDINTNDDKWEETVFEKAKETLLQCATPDAVVCLGSSHLSSEADTLAEKYFHDQHHSSLADFLLHNIQRKGRAGISAQVTTHGRLLSRHDIPILAETLGFREAAVQLLSLQQFDTEQQFSRRIGMFLEETLAEGGLMVVQCDSGDINTNLIACASYTVQAERAHTGNLRSIVVFVIQIPRNTTKSFSGLGGGQWLCYHIDDVHPPNDYSPDVAAMLGKSVSSLVKPRVANLPDQDDDTLTDLCEAVNTIQIQEDSPRQDLQTDSLAPLREKQTEPIPQGIMEPVKSDMEDRLDVATLLHSSVQSAAARLTDPSVVKHRTIDRIDILLKLLANKGKHHEARLTFAEVLGGRVAQLLKEQEECQVHMGSNWLSQEAAASKAIRQAGTLRRSAWVYLKSVVSPMLAEVIAFFDRNFNLDLLKTKEEWLRQLWLHIAANDKAINLHYEDCLSPKKRTVRGTVPVQTSGYDGQLFHCHLPFSWLIRELVDKLWQDAAVMIARTYQPFQEVLRNTFDETEIGRQLSKATKSCTDPAEIIVKYIHDYVLMTHRITTGSEVEFRVFCRAVQQAVSILRESKEIPQVPHITDVHVAVDDVVRGSLSRFSQLVRYWPDQLPTLEADLRDRPNMKLDVTALHLALEKLTEELGKLTTAMHKQHWGSKLQSVGLLAEDLLAAYKVSSSEQQPEGQLNHSLWECRCLLARLRVAKLYLDHLSVGDQPLPMQQVEQLWNHLAKKKEPNFKTKPTMKKLELFLVKQSKQAASKHFAGGSTECCICHDELRQPVILPCKHVCDQGCLKNWLRPGKRTCPKCRQPVPEDCQLLVSFQSKEALRKHQAFRRRSNAFFMDVVSMFCFADEAPPHQEVIDMLLGYIVREVDDNQARTKSFSPFQDECVDRTPIIRSFLLQMLLRFKFPKVLAHLERYFEGARGFAGGMDDAVEVCVIFLQCMENALTSQVDRMPERQVHLIELASSELERAAKHCKGFPNIPLMLQLHMLASIRFGLSIACDLMYSHVDHPSGRVVNEHNQRSLQRLFVNVQTIFRDFEPVTRWPKLFIPRYLYRRYGLDTLLTVSQSPDSQWFLPDEMRGDQGDVIPDRFVVYGEAYQLIREATARTIVTHDISQLGTILRGIPQQDRELLTLLAIFTEMTMARASAQQNTDVFFQIQQMLVQFLRSTSAIKNKELAWRLLLNNRGGHCTLLSFRPNQPPRQRSLSALIVHMDTVLATTPTNPLLEPLKALAAAPHTMLAHYLPTMPSDPLPELKRALADQQVGWYQCPKGHHYVIGDCMKPATVGKCHCGADIGGIGYKLKTGNLPGRQNDATSTGHIIGDAQDRPAIPIPERQLSKFETIITRLVLHASMLCGANKSIQPFTNFVRPVPPDINDFLWRHLNRDLDDLARVLGRSIDDATLLVHILLATVSKSGNKAVAVWNVAWTSVQGRENWENVFSDAYIMPLLQDLDNRLEVENRLVDENHRLIASSFHRVLSDITTPPDQLSLENVIGLPEMWQYRPSVSLEHMSRCFVEHQARFPMLKMFLDNAIILSAMCHLPDIIHLITLLRTRYHRNIDLTEALTMKIAEFLKSLPEGQQREECDRLVKYFGEIWTNIRPLLLQQDNTPRPVNMDPSIDTQTTSLYHLLPMKEDATITSCMTAVVLFLIRKNNEFLDIYRREANFQDDGYFRSWTDVSTSNVVSCDTTRDLMPLVLSHCNYSLAIGQETQVGYDFPALEKQLIDRFLSGRSKIEEKCETFQFRQEARDVAMFSAVRKQIAQETMSLPVQRQIVLESTSLENVCVSLAAVDISIFFLASAGGDGEKLLGEYLHRVLKMGRAARLHSDKARNYCRLKHALSLWQLLSVQRAQLLLANNQDPFDNVVISYTKQLEEEQMKALESTLKKMDVKTLAAEMYEFVVVSDDKEKRKPDWSLRDTLASYLDEKDAPEINGFLPHFPATILLENVCDTWRILANYMHNHEEDSTGNN